MVIRPISDLRNTNEISEQCHKTDGPVFITKNGYGDMVIMSMEYYEKCIKSTPEQENKNAAPAQQGTARFGGNANTNTVHTGFNSTQSGGYTPVQENAPETVYEKQPTVQNNESFEGIRHIREKYAKK